MNAGYIERRATKHAAERAARKSVIEGVVNRVVDLVSNVVVDLVSNVPRLSFLTFKTRPQSTHGRKNRSGHSPEHDQALVDNVAVDVAKANAVVLENLKNNEEAAL